MIQAREAFQQSMNIRTSFIQLQRGGFEWLNLTLLLCQSVQDCMLNSLQHVVHSQKLPHYLSEILIHFQSPFQTRAKIIKIIR